MEKLTKIIDIKLNQTQMNQYKDWKSHLIGLYGEIGLLTWIITPNGIGESITVYSHKAKVELDLTDIDSW
jgi:hypothetical protein